MTTGKTAVSESNVRERCELESDERAYRIDYVRDLIELAANSCAIRSARERSESRGVRGDGKYGYTSSGTYLGSAGNLMGDILVHSRDSGVLDHLHRAVRAYVSSYLREALTIYQREIATQRAVFEALSPGSSLSHGLSDDEQRREQTQMTAELTDVALEQLATEACAFGDSWKTCSIDELRVTYHGGT